MSIQNWKIPMSLALFVQVAGCTSSTVERPLFVDELIAKLQGAEKRNPPASVWRYIYQGADVYYVPPYCCDVAGELYDPVGGFVCAPDGGLTGQGDGKCPDFFQERSHEALIWVDPR